MPSVAAAVAKFGDGARIDDKGPIREVDLTALSEPLFFLLRSAHVGDNSPGIHRLPATSAGVKHVLDDGSTARSA
jgi:hypothetical protein